MSASSPGGLLGPTPAPSFHDDPLGVLLACHSRMRRQLTTLERLARHVTDRGADDDARAAAHTVLRYFDKAAVDHHADEDASLLPRLLQCAPDLAADIAAIGTEHQALGDVWRKLRPLLSEIAAGHTQSLPPLLVRELCDGYDAHLAREEAVIIPRARECLSPALLAEIGGECAARRETTA